MCCHPFGVVVTARGPGSPGAAPRTSSTAHFLAVPGSGTAARQFSVVRLHHIEKYNYTEWFT